MLVSATGPGLSSASACACASLAGMARAAGDSDKAAEDGARPSKPAGAPVGILACLSATSNFLFCRQSQLHLLLLAELDTFISWYTDAHLLQWWP